MEINLRTSYLNRLILELKEYENFLDYFLFLENYDKFNNQISPTDRLNLNWNLAYSQYTMYYSNIIFNNI